MKKILISGLVTLTFLSACTGNDQPETSTESEESVGEEDIDTADLEQDDTANGLEVVADNLDIPWSIETFEDTIYITERPGFIVAIRDGASERQELELGDDISTASEAGLLGFVISPNYSETSEAYAYYTYESNEGQFNRIVLLELEDNIWRESDVLLDHIPSGSVHHGGRLLIGPDEHLYATTGDASIPEIAQDLTSLGGKIVRLNLDGSVPVDNPFTDSYVYSYGHRNPQGLAWSTDDTLYSSEHEIERMMKST